MRLTVAQKEPVDTLSSWLECSRNVMVNLYPSRRMCDGEFNDANCRGNTKVLSRERARMQQPTKTLVYK
jgi:hypothetical protein